MSFAASRHDGHAEIGEKPRQRRIGPRIDDDEAGVDATGSTLQSNPHDDPLLVSLNTLTPIRPGLVYDTVAFRHPIRDVEALAAQDTIRAINGINRDWFYGAWLGNGFHEGGLVSGLRLAGQLGRPAAFDLAAE